VESATPEVVTQDRYRVTAGTPVFVNRKQSPRSRRDLQNIERFSRNILLRQHFHGSVLVSKLRLHAIRCGEKPKAGRIARCRTKLKNSG